MVKRRGKQLKMENEKLKIKTSERKSMSIKMVSEKRVAANRRNALLSTGPRTKQGKAVSRMNALRHGLLARQVVARGYLHQESEQEFKTLYREYEGSLS